MRLASSPPAVVNHPPAISSPLYTVKACTFEFTPLPSKDYPGVREARYRLRATGRFADFIGFLGEFEQQASWTDITFVNLTSPEAESDSGKSGVMVVSLYSAITASPGPQDDEQP